MSDVEKKDEVVEEKEEEKDLDPQKLKEQIENLNKALKEERENRKALKSQVEQYQMYLEQLKEKKEEPEENIELDEDSYLTYGEFKKIYELQRKRELEEQQKALKKQQEFNEKLIESENEFRETHKDYDDVVKILEKVIREDKELASYLMSDPKKAPARAYKIAKAFIASSEKKKEAEETIELLEKQGKKPATQGVRSANTIATASPKEAAEMSIQEYEEYVKNLTPEQRRKITGLA